MNVFPKTIIPEKEIIRKISGKYSVSDRFLLSSGDKETLKTFFHDNAKENFYYFLKNFLGRKKNGNYFEFRDNALINAIQSDGKCNIGSTEDSLTVHQLNPESSTVTFANDYLPVKGTLLFNMQYYGNADYIKIFNNNTEIKLKVQDGILIVSAKSQVSDEVVSGSIQIKSKKYFWTNQEYDYFCFALSYFENKIILAHNNLAVELQFKQNLDTALLNLDIYKNLYDLVISEYESDAEFLKGFQEMIGTEISFSFGAGSVSLSKTVDVYLQAKERIIAMFAQDSLEPEQRGANFLIQLKLQEV